MAMSFFCVSQNKYHALLEHVQVHIAQKNNTIVYDTVCKHFKQYALLLSHDLFSGIQWSRHN